MKNATMLYKVPGPHETNGGITFDYIVVGEEEIESFERKGWSRTIPEAQDKKKKREDLEAKAEEKGVKFDGRTSDAKLEKLLDDHLGPLVKKESQVDELY